MHHLDRASAVLGVLRTRRLQDAGDHVCVDVRVIDGRPTVDIDQLTADPTDLGTSIATHHTGSATSPRHRRVHRQPTGPPESHEKAASVEDQRQFSAHDESAYRQLQRR